MSLVSLLDGVTTCEASEPIGPWASTRLCATVAWLLEKDEIRATTVMCGEGGRRGDILGSLGSVATQDGLPNRIHGCLGLVDTVQGGLGGGTNSCVISTSGFSDDGLKSTLWN